MLTASQASIWELPGDERRVEGLDRHGRPDPAYAEALGLVTAPLGRRTAAALIDIGVYVVLLLPFIFLALPLLRRLLTGRITWYGFVNHPDFLVCVIVAAVTLLLTILFLVTQVVVQAKWGFTLGKLATGLRAVNVSTLAKPGFWRAAGRALLAWAPVVTVLGTLVVLASPLWSRDRRRGWHDLVGRTWLVDVRQGLNPYDAKRMRIARKTVTSTPAPRAMSLPSLATTTSGDATNAYRPGARTSAGVLGAARPHAVDGRVVVGLTGFEPGQPAPVPEVGNSEPRLGAYLPTTPAAPDAVAPDSTVGAAITLLFDSGQSVQLSGPVVIGRAPVAVDGALPLAVADPDSSMSKTHVVLRPVAAGLEVIDQGSTNGTALVREGQEQPLAMGEVGVARFGDTLRIGDRTARVLGS